MTSAYQITAGTSGADDHAANTAAHEELLWRLNESLPLTVAARSGNGRTLLREPLAWFPAWKRRHTTMQTGRLVRHERPRS